MKKKQVRDYLSSKENRRKLYIRGIQHLILLAIISVVVSKFFLSDKSLDIQSFTLIHFAGYLFFIVMPVETLIPIYLSAGHSGITLIIIALLTAMFAQMIDYAIGYAISHKIRGKLISEKRFAKMETQINKWGGLTIFIFNLFPLSSPILAAVAGMIRFSFRKLIFYSFLGLTIKYVVIVLLF